LNKRKLAFNRGGYPEGKRDSPAPPRLGRITT
jgi:hypothetical protein